MGIEAIPITNVENACAGGSTAFHHAWLGVASGLYDITMAVGAEKLNNPNKYAVFAGFSEAWTWKTFQIYWQNYLCME